MALSRPEKLYCVGFIAGDKEYRLNDRTYEWEEVAEKKEFKLFRFTKGISKQ